MSTNKMTPTITLRIHAEDRLYTLSIEDDDAAEKYMAFGIVDILTKRLGLAPAREEIPAEEGGINHTLSYNFNIEMVGRGAQKDPNNPNVLIYKFDYGPLEPIPNAEYWPLPELDEPPFVLGSVVALASDPNIPLTVSKMHGSHLDLTYINGETGALEVFKYAHWKTFVPYSKPESNTDTL